MTAVSREKIALVVFVLLVLVGIGSLVAYLNIGHNWNVTASQIDDATGELEGYTAILYAGIAEPEQAKSSDRSAVVGSSTAAEGDSASTAGEGTVLGERNDNESVTTENAGGSSVDEATAGEKAYGEEPSSEESSNEEPLAESVENAGREEASSGTSARDASTVAESHATSTSASASRKAGGATPLFASSCESSSESKQPITVEDAAASYRDKQATVFVLDVENPSKYAEGMILKKGNRRFGVFSVAFNEPLPSVQAKVDYLRECAVDFVVAITPDRSFVQRATGVDIAISLENEGASFMGGSENGTFYADSPLVGQVGSILISPYNVVSAKDIEEL